MQFSTDDRGITLIETIIAVGVALFGVFSLGSVIFTMTATNKNQGTEVTRATVYALDKMEKVLSLDFSSCTQSGGSQPVSCNSTGITDSGWTTGLLAGGPISSTAITGAPAALTCPTAAGASIGYVDFLDVNGNQLSGSCSAVTGGRIAYIREWTIADMTPLSGGPALKQITVAVYSQLSVQTGSGKPIVLITSVLTDPN
jgi:hypothetical protein